MSGALLFALIGMNAISQQPAPAGGSLSSSLGVYVFPAKNQSADQQSADEGACFNWAKGQTGIDPMSIKPVPAKSSTPAQGGSSPQGGQVVKGAAVGAGVGAISGNAGEGAAIGAVAGGVAKRREERQVAAQQQQQAAATAQASVADQKSRYNKAFSACMEGKGYTVK